MLSEAASLYKDWLIGTEYCILTRGCMPSQPFYIKTGVNLQSYLVLVRRRYKVFVYVKTLQFFCQSYGLYDIICLNYAQDD